MIEHLSRERPNSKRERPNWQKNAPIASSQKSDCLNHPGSPSFTDQYGVLRCSACFPKAAKAAELAAEEGRPCGDDRDQRDHGLLWWPDGEPTEHTCYLDKCRLLQSAEDLAYSQDRPRRQGFFWQFNAADAVAEKGVYKGKTFRQIAASKGGRKYLQWWIRQKWCNADDRAAIAAAMKGPLPSQDI